MPLSEHPSGGTRGAGAVLSVDLHAIAANYRQLADRLGPGLECGGVVKADAYGLGLDAVVPALWQAGCRGFFVALAEEGFQLRALLPDAVIYVFNGVDADTAPDMAEAGLIPVLNHPGQIEAWADQARVAGALLTAMLHVDTGMNRLGLSTSETDALTQDPASVAGLAIECVMSHLACADEPTNPLNAEQLDRFKAALVTLAPLGIGRASLANSSAIFLDAPYHFDLARPGAALYGLSPNKSAPNPMAQVIKLEGKILQTRSIDSPSGVGYGATHQVGPGQRIATVGIGYADGFLRSLSNSASANIGGVRVPIVGRVSMDLISIDVTAVPESLTNPGQMVELIGPGHSADDLAGEAGTIGYEILTALGRRFTRRYEGTGST
jgi:alanine racemase